MTVEVLQRYAPVPSTTVLLDLYLAEQAKLKDEDYTPSGRLSASQLAGCDWAIWAKYRKIPTLSGPTPKTLRRWHYGRMVEDHIRKVHRYAGTLLAEEVHLVDETLGVGVSGYIDNVLGGSYGDLSWPVSTVQEVKSLTANQMSWFYKKNEGPRDSWKLQLGTYALIVRRKGWDVKSGDLIVPPPKAWVITAAAGDSGGEMDFPMLTSWAEDAQRRIEELSEIVSSETEPRCLCPTMYNGKGSHYCDFAQWRGGEDRDDPKVMPITCCYREEAA